MKNNVKYLLCAFVLLLFCQQNYAKGRTVHSINDSWQFRFSETCEGNEGWTIVSVPHSWNDKDCLDDVSRYTRGKGWYRRNLYVDKEMASQPLYIYFEGANQRTEVFVNGQKAGEHIGGYTFFCFDITKFVKEGTNELTVSVDNSHDLNIPPLSADFTFFGGLYRDVSLVSTAPVHVSLSHYASSGVYITTPEVTDKEASVHVKYMLTNSLPEKASMYVESTILSPSGECVTVSKKKVKLQPNQTNQEFADELVVKAPQLWDIETPNQYRLQTRILTSKGEVVDQVVNRFGIRTFSFSAEEGFILNGKKVKLMGTNRHQCYKEKGNALRDEMHVRDIRLLQQMGGNFLRVAHYPQDAMVLAACDRMGIVTSVEIPIIDLITMTEEFSNCCVEMMKEMIYQCFNSPSVCIWTYMNEVMLRPPYNKDKSINKEAYWEYVHSIAEKIENTTREIDPYRYTMLPIHNSLSSYEKPRLTELPKILGINLYNGWYSGTFDGFEKMLDHLHEKYPQTPIIVSEYGADVDTRIHSFKPERFDYSVDYGLMYHRHYLPEIIKRDFVVASAVWNLNDFHSEGRQDAVPHINCKGLVTLDRTPKDAYRYYQAMLLKEPYVAIGGCDWVNRTGIADANGIGRYPVQVFSNAQSVTLKVNQGEAEMTAKVENGVATFEVPFKNGLNTLEAEISKNGKKIIDFYKLNMNLVPDQPKKFGNFRELNMLLGSNRSFEDRDADLAWMPERAYNEGGWGYVGGKAFRNASNRGSLPASNLDIWGTDQDPIFQTQRRGLQSFKADVPDGDYVVYFYWAELAGGKAEALAYNLGEIKSEEASERMFHVDINGERILRDLDVEAEVGGRRPMICKIPVSVMNNEGLTIDFIPIKGETMLSAIRILKLD